MFNKNAYNETSVIRGCLKNERQSQESLYRHYAELMYSICLSYASSREEAQDILQDGFMKIFNSIKHYKKAGSFEGWMRRVITNTAIDYYRKTTRTNKYIERQSVYHESSELPVVYEKLSVDYILENVQTLPHGARVIFNLYAVEGFTHEEISKKLNISVGTSKSQYSRAKGMLQNKLKSLKHK